MQYICDGRPKRSYEWMEERERPAVSGAEIAAALLRAGLQTGDQHEHDNELLQTAGGVMSSPDVKPCCLILVCC